MTKKKTAATKKSEKVGTKTKKPSKSSSGGGAKAATASSAGEAGDASTARGSASAGAVADSILEAEDRGRLVVEQAELMHDERSGIATKAARVLAEIVAKSPQAVVPVIDRFVLGLTSPQKRVVQTSADALPQLAKLAPARVAKHLEKLKRAFDEASEVGQDGIVRTFAALCIASVAYQKRLEPVLTHALSGAEGKVLVRWVEIVLPALKGEPHARARAVVEDRLYSIPRSVAQKVADFLGVRLRTSYRG